MFESICQFKNHEEQYLPFYHSANDLTQVQHILKSQTSLVSIEEINQFRQLLARASMGEHFLIQLSDCSGSFYDCDQDTAYAQLEFIQQLAEFFQMKTREGIIQVGQITGQADNNFYEISQNKKIYSCFDHTVNQWNRTLRPEQKIHTSHEALLFHDKQAVTHWDERTGLYYNRSTHFLWLDKCNINSSQHSDYLKKIANPIAVRIGPDVSIENLIQTINKLDPDDLPGRITLIPGLGAQSVHHTLPQLIETVSKMQRTVLWSCDPMYGNTELIGSGIKIRRLSNIVEEIKSSFSIHKQMGSQLNGIYLEATHQDITECMDYQSSIDEWMNDSNKKCNSLINNRLNFAQTMHVMQYIVMHLKKVL